MTVPIQDLGTTTPRVVPPGAKRWGWWSWGWAAIFALFAVLEGTAIWRNRRGGLHDYQHRTLSENLWAVFAMHPDTQLKAPFAKTRRFLWQTFYGWFGRHVQTNGREM